MFAYCLNSPTNGCDPCGTCFHRWDFWNDCEKCKAFWDGVGVWCTNAYNYVTNEDPQVAQNNLQTNNFTFYKGTMVFSTPLPFDQSAFSFGVIVMDDYYPGRSLSDFSETLNHEYGHFEHMKQIGLPGYAVTTAVPSLVFAGIAEAKIPVISSWVDKNYHSLPWERIANVLGGTNYSHTTWSNTTGALFWMFTILMGNVISYG